MIVIGLDPGISGAVAILDDEGMNSFDMPILEIKRGTKTKRIVDACRLAEKLRGIDGHAFVEIAGSRPPHRRGKDGEEVKEGVASSFSNGRNYGRIEGVIAALGIPITDVSPAKWKKDLRVPAEKDGARFRASQLLPRYADQWPLKKHDGRAEAALIALWGWNSFLSEYKT
jgi:crossover junction endodeoxyribonuclease RuvC